MNTTVTNGNHTVNCAGNLHEPVGHDRREPGGSLRSWQFDVMVGNSVVGLTCSISGTSATNCTAAGTLDPRRRARS